MTWEHIEQDWLKKYLEGKSPMDTQRALEYTEVCVSEDADNEDVSATIFELRRDYLDDALYAWEQEADPVWTLDSLRMVWRY